MSELMPCPFCGESKAKVYHNTSSDHMYDWDFHAECECGVVGPSDKQEAQAVTEWNRRAAPAQELSALPELVELLNDIRPKHGAVGSRDVDVTRMQKQIDAAISMLCRQQGGSDAARLDMLDGENFVALNCYVQVYGHQGAPLDTERKFYVVELESQIETVEGATVREAIDAAIAAIQAQAGDAKGGA